MKLIIVILGVFLVLGANAEAPESVSSEEVIDLEDAVQQFGILDKIKCKLCEEAMRPIAKQINKHSSKEEIKKALDRACTIIPEKRLRRKCRNAIKERGDEIAGKIIENLSAKAICKVLQFC